MRNRVTNCIILFCLGFFASIFAFAQNPVKPFYTSEEIIIDGNLDEKTWNQSDFISDFITYKPDFGKQLEDATFASIVYDEENIYCAFRCLESDPGKIIATLAARDKIVGQDWVCIGIDSKNDQQGMHAFIVNPLGIQYDSYASATDEDSGVDLVWYSAGKITENGYTVEIKIPFKSLRYSSKLPVQMGVILERSIGRSSTNATYPALDPQRGGEYLTQLAKIELDNIKHYKLFEVLPSVTYSYHKSRNGGSLEEDLNKVDPGFNIKYGITSSLMLDGTFNPDFSQVEADAGQVDINLRSHLYYQEKRPFFLEGNDKYAVAATRTSVVDPLQYIVYTRTIENPIAGAKLTGNINKKNSIAVLYAADETINPADNSTVYSQVPIIRYKYNFLDDNYLGATFTGRDDKFTKNQMYGIDGKYRLNKSTTLEFSGFNTNTNDTTGNHSGHAFGFMLVRSKRSLDYILAQRDIAKNFNAASGYFTRTGVSQFSGLIRPRIYSDSLFIKRIDFELFASQTYDKFYSMWENFNHVSAQLYLWNTTILKVKYSLSNEIFMGNRFNTNGFHVLLSGRLGNWLNASVLYRRVNSIYYSSAPFGGLSNQLSGSVVLTPLSKLNIEFDHVFNDFSVKGESTKIYDYQIERLQVTYQINKYLFLRNIEEYNSYRKTLMSDFLASFTYVPGTVCHIGYGTLFRQSDVEEPFFGGNIKPLEEKRGLFIKLSYLFRT